MEKISPTIAHCDSEKAESGFGPFHKAVWRAEWPTLLVICTCIIFLPLVTFASATLTLWVSVPLLTIVLALHSSLQHEVLHGHPFSNPLLNEALIFVSAGLFVPYRRYRATHLLHHFDPNLTDPYEDPESNYLDPAVWSSLCWPVKVLRRFNNTLAGRMLVGPAISMFGFYKSDFTRCLRGERGVISAYTLHFIGFFPIAIWLQFYATIPFWAYFIAAYGGMSLLMVRTFLEHQAHQTVPGRTVIVEDRGPLSLLFLNNNFHLVHHAHPKVAWYKLPALYHSRKDEFLRRNGGYFYPSYATVFRKHLFRTKDQVPHPLWARSEKPE